MNPEASKVRRCLFGRPDHKQLEADLQKELKKDTQEMNEKWDFDFQKGKPLKGNKFQWEAVEDHKGDCTQHGDCSGVVEMPPADKEITKNSKEQHAQDYQTP